LIKELIPMRSTLLPGGLLFGVALILFGANTGRSDEVPAEYRKSIDKGLEWLAKNQSKDGHWASLGDQYPMTMTAMGGLALLMEGSTIREGKYKDNIRRAADWLMARSMPNGMLGNPNIPGEAGRYMYGHGFSLLFLSCIYGEEEEGDRRKKLEDILVRAAKFHKSRRLPLSPDAVQALDAYLAGRRARRPDTTVRMAPLIWKGGTAVHGYSSSRWTQLFQALARQAGVLKADGRPPRVHDLRHSFAVHALLRWYRAGVDVQAKLPFLSTYMGHVSIVSTQYYLHFVEPVAHAASARFAQHYGALLTPHATEEHP